MENEEKPSQVMKYVYRKPLAEPYSYFEISGETEFNDIDMTLKTIKMVIDDAFPAPVKEEKKEPEIAF